LRRSTRVTSRAGSIFFRYLAAVAPPKPPPTTTTLAFLPAWALFGRVRKALAGAAAMAALMNARRLNGFMDVSLLGLGGVVPGHGLEVRFV
jgi:hypothetical protein